MCDALNGAFWDAFTTEAKAEAEVLGLEIEEITFSGGKLAVLSYVGLSLPLALALGFGASLASVGLMAGHVAGKVVHAMASLVLVGRTRWSDQSDRAIKRVHQLRASVGDANGGGSAEAKATADGVEPAEAAVQHDGE